MDWFKKVFISNIEGMGKTVSERLKKVEELKTGESTLLQEAHDLVINSDFPDIPEALDFITDQDHDDSLMHFMVELEEYEQCAQILKDKRSILETIDGDLN